MKYSVSINQKAFYELSDNLDFLDAAIFDFMKDFMHTSRCVKVHFDGEIFYWISHQLIIDNLPLLRINTKRGIIKRIEKLEVAGLLIRHENSRKLNRTYYKVGNNYDAVIFNKKETTYERLFIAPMNNGSEVPMNENSEYYNNKKDYSNNNKVADTKKSAPVKDLEYKDFVDKWARFFEYKTKNKPSFNGVDGKAIKSIRAKIKTLIKNNGSEEKPIDLFHAILMKWDYLDQWQRDNYLDLKTFNSKFNLIIAKIKDIKQDGELTEEIRTKYGWGSDN